MDENILLDVEDVDVLINGEPLIHKINFTLQRGEICALVGHNGAGKTVTMKAIMGMHKKNRGSINLNGVNIDEDYLLYKSQYAYIPEEPLLFTELTVYQHFQLYGTSYQVNETLFEERVHDLVEGLELTGKMYEFPDNLSKGMRQKVNIISSLLTDAPLLIIDEPFIGLDHHAAQFLENQIYKKAKEGTAVLLTSHVMERVKKFSHSFIMLQNGEIAKRGTIDHLDNIERRVSR